MAKLSEPLKALINAAHARPGTVRAPNNIRAVYARIAESAAAQHVGVPAWLTLSTAATMTMNSPEALLELFRCARETDDDARSLGGPVHAAELMREVGLKCISFNGIPRTINCLGAFRDGLPEDISRALSTTPTRHLTSANIEAVITRGQTLWKSVYLPFEAKLVNKLALSHPDLPVFIIESEYGPLLADPTPRMPGIKVGRVLTSVLAVACLRAQTGVGPQVISHIFGLRKAFENGTAGGEDEVQGGKWLASDEGSTWILERVDEIVSAISEGQGTSFAPGIKAKL